jgi:SepF-like predicted cell division protein (DUF552 family)
MVIFGKKKEEESYVEVDESKLANKKGINIKIEELNSFADTDKIQNIVREGNVVFLRIKNLRQKDINELKRSVDKLKKTIIANEGDIVGVDEDFLILTPKFVKVFR